MDKQQMQTEIARLQAIDQTAFTDMQRAKHTEALTHMQQTMRLAV